MGSSPLVAGIFSPFISIFVSTWLLKSWASYKETTVEMRNSVTTNIIIVLPA